MNKDEHDAYRIFRTIGSTGLVIFERDGILLRRQRLSRDFMLGDISNEFVEMLAHLRQLNVRFGFISDDRGMDAGSRGRPAFAALSRLLDGLLRIRHAVPDFWMAWPDFLQGTDAQSRGRDGQRQSPSVRMILHAIEWYGAEKQRTIFVCATAAGLIAANDADVIGIRYFGVQNDRVRLSRAETEPHPPPPAIPEIDRLRTQIERILGVGRRRKAWL